MPSVLRKSRAEPPAAGPLPVVAAPVARTRRVKTVPVSPAEASGAALSEDVLLARFRAARWIGLTTPLEVEHLRFGDAKRPFWDSPATAAKPGRPWLWLEHVHPLDQRRVADFFAETPRGSIDYRLLQGSGEVLWVRHEVLHAPTRADGRHAIDSLLRCIEEEKRGELECLRVSERERSTIGQELHDDVCQILTGLNYLLQVIGRRVGETRPDLQAEMQELSKQVSDAAVRARSLAHGLFPARLNHDSLVPALKELSRQMEMRFPVKVLLDAPRDVPAQGIEHVVHVFRIVQESVSNAVKHGAASQVQLRLFAAGGHAHLVIEDNGTGLPVESSRPEGIGMHTMRYRTRELGGEIEFTNRPEGGARVALRLPLLRRSHSAAAK